MSVAAIRVAARGTLAGVSDRVAGVVFLLTGALLAYLALFDQGAAVTLVTAATGRESLLHEFFHDGRHLWNSPCH